MKNRLALLAGAGMALSLLTACGASSASGNGDTIKIGALFPMSGEAAFLGENIAGRGARLAVDVANDNGGVLDKDVKLVVQDDQRRTEPAVSGMRALLGEQVAAGIGPTSATIPAVLNQLKQGSTPWIPVGSTSVLDSGLSGTPVFRNFASDSQQIPAMLLAAAKQGGRIGLVFENNASGQQQMEAVKRYAGAVDGITIADEALLAPGQNSYQSEASSFFDNDYDAVLWQLTDTTASGFFKSASQTGDLQGQFFIGTDAALSDSLLGILKPYLGEATWEAVTPASAGEGRAKFTDLYKTAFNSGPVVLSDVGYDATTVLMLAIEAAGTTDHDAVTAAVTKVASAPGTTCTWFKECADLLRDGKDIDYQGAMNGVDFNDEHNVVSPFAAADIDAQGKVSGETDVAFTTDEIAKIYEAGR